MERLPPVSPSSTPSPPPPETVGAADRRGAPPTGIGGDHGRIASPPKNDEGIVALFFNLLDVIKNFFNDIHDNLFFCMPSQPETRPKLPGSKEHPLIHLFLKKWFPEEITLCPNDSHETMIAELKKLTPEAYQVIIGAFNRATEKDLSHDTEPESLIKDHLSDVTTLPRGYFRNNEHLIRPYGLDQTDFQQDFDRLPEGIQEELKRYVSDGRSGIEYYQEHMGQLKELLSALEGSSLQ